MRSFASRQVRTGDGAPAATAQIKYLHIAECPWVGVVYDVTIYTQIIIIHTYREISGLASDAGG